MKALAIFAAILAVLYGAYVYAYPSVTVRYRLTAEMMVDGAKHVGSGVLQVTYAKVIGAPGSNVRQRIELRGEAIPVDLGERGTLFVLLTRGSGPYSGPERTLPKAFGFPNGLVEIPPSADYERLRALSGRREVAMEDLPLLVRFRDVKDPTTVERVNPNNLAETFGQGVSLERVYIEVTNDPVSSNIERRLPWLATHRGLLDGNRYTTSPKLVNNLGSGDFKRSQ